MRIIKIKIIALVLLQLAQNHLVAQTGSPYNRFGLGYLNGSNFSTNMQMGGLSASYTPILSINSTNPASLSNLAYTTFEAGGTFHGLHISTTDSLYKAGNGNLSHIALGFPIKRGYAGGAIVFKPYSNVRYAFGKANTDTTVDYYEYYTGNGNLYQAQIGFGGQYKGVSLGFSTGALFGNVKYQNLLEFDNNYPYLSTNHSNEVSYRGFIWDLGLQYRHKLPIQKREDDNKSPIYVTAGVYGNGPYNINLKSSNLWIRYDDYGIRDTIGEETETQEKMKLPTKLGIGISFDQAGKWSIGTEFVYENWSKFETPLGNFAHANKYRWILGAEIMPRKQDDNKYYNLITYRVGTYLGKSELLVDNEHLSDYGITFGLGLPVKNAFSMINIGFEYENRGTTRNNLYREEYFKVNLGFVFNDRWFIKRKYD